MAKQAPSSRWCHICSKRASLLCDNCNQPACSEHIQMVGKQMYCSECITQLAATAQQEKDK